MSLVRSSLFVAAALNIFVASALAHNRIDVMPEDNTYDAMASAVRSFQEIPASSRDNPSNPAVFKALSEVRKAALKLSSNADKFGLGNVSSLSDRELIARMKRVHVADSGFAGGKAGCPVMIFALDPDGGLKTKLIGIGQNVPSEAELAEEFPGCAFRREFLSHATNQAFH